MTVRLTVHVQPGARAAGLGGFRPDGALRLKVSEPARDGRANQAVIELLRRALGLPRAGVALVHGLGSRTKLVEIEGLTAEQVRARLAAAGKPATRAEDHGHDD
jgi:uncharacterized protein YggU (UPF0235/DUF167 family)